MEPGTIVEYIDQQRIMIAAVLEIKQKRLRLLTESNREMAMNESRLAHASTMHINLSAGREAIVAGLKEAVSRREALKQKIDIRELWELLSEENEWINLRTMTEYCFSGEITSDHESAVLRSFFDNRIYFKFNSNKFLPNSEKQVELILSQRREEQRKQALIETGGDWLSQVIKDPNPSVPEEMTEVIDIVKSYYLLEKDSKTSDLGKAILARAGIDLSDKIFKLFVRMGIWDVDENLNLIRLDIPRQFSRRVLDHAALLAPPVNFNSGSHPKKDFTGLDIITIDGESTKDFDDALSVQVENGHYILGIHIIDVDHYIKKGDVLDQCGLNRGSSIYMPDITIPMLPEIVSENLCSLRQGELRPAISTMVRLSKFYEIIDVEVVPSIIRVARQLTYTETAEMIDTDETIGTLYGIAAAFRKTRLNNSAIQITLPDINVSVTENREITVTATDRESPSRMLVSELMIMANWLCGKMLAESQVPAIFRSQPEPKARLYQGESDSLYLNYMQRKQVSRVIIGAEPEYHSGLGVNAYITCTSPIRRYFDLITQRQIKSVIGLSDPFTREEIMQLYQSLEQTLANVGRTQYMRHRYWLLKYLEAKKGEKTNGIILEKKRDAYFVLMPEFLLECKLSARGVKFKPQDIVQLVIQHVDARKDLISVFPG